MRATTPELSELERDISSAAEKSLAIEQKFFEQFVADVSSVCENIGTISKGVAELDVAISFAILAKEKITSAQKWMTVRPLI